MANEIQEYDATTPGNNTLVGAISIAELMLPGNVNNALREFISQVKRAVANQGSDIASAGTTDIGAATGQYVKVTGTTTITSFGTVNAGTSRWVEFTGALTLTHNATSLILEGGANYTTSAGDMIFAVSEGSGNWRVRIFPASGKPVVPSSNGKHKLWIPAAAMRPDATNAPSSADVVINSIQYYTLDFDQTTNEYAHFSISMPSSWNEGTITFVPVWTAASGSGDVYWLLSAAAKSNDDAISQTFSTFEDSLDTLLSAGDLHRGPESDAYTIEATPAANDMVFFRIRRFSSDASDTLNADARLLGVEIYITLDAATDSA